MNPHHASTSDQVHQDDWSLNTSLINQLRADSFDSRSRRLTVVCAPMGYGKTPTVMSWLHGDATTVKWIRLTPEADLWEQVSRKLHAFIAPGEAYDLVRSSVEMTKVLSSQLTNPFTLVIDEYQYATSAENDLLLAELSSTYSLLSVVVLARQVTLLDQRILPAHTRVRLIGPSELSLSDEALRDLPARLCLPHSTHVAEALESTEGWPLAITAALQLGDDHFYTTTATGRVWSYECAERTFDPLEHLRDFALDMLDLLDPISRRVVLATAQLNSLNGTSMATVLGLPQADAERGIHTLLDHGLIVAHRSIGPTYYRVHRSVQPALTEHALRTIDVTERQALYAAHATDLQHTAPFTSFRFYLEAEQYAEAELVLARNINLITDEYDTARSLFRTLPEQELVQHPTFIAAFMILEIADPETSRNTLRRLFTLWHQGLTEKTPGSDDGTPAEFHLPYLLQRMVLSRLTGHIEQAKALLTQLDDEVLPSHIVSEADHTSYVPMRTVVSFAGALATFLLETAQTALVAGNYTRARQGFEKLRRHSRLKISRPHRALNFASTRTVTDEVSGTRWLLAALSGLAYLSFVEGDMRACAELLTEHDELATATGLSGAGLSVLDREIARAHLSYELGDPALLQQAIVALEHYRSRLDPTHLLSAQVNALRATQGPVAALTHFQAGATVHPDAPAAHSSWRENLAGFEAMLNTTLGNLDHAHSVLDSGRTDEHIERIERLRLDLYSGDDLSAMSEAEQIGDPGYTIRQRIDRMLILAVAAWNTDHTETALEAVRTAATDIDRYQVTSQLLGVPYEQLREVTVAALDAATTGVGASGTTDTSPAAADTTSLQLMLEYLDQLPLAARTRRYERLTDSELRALSAVATHRNANLAANELFVTPGTIKKHLTSVNRKLGTRTRDEAILQARAMRLI